MQHSSCISLPSLTKTFSNTYLLIRFVCFHFLLFAYFMIYFILFCHLCVFVSSPIDFTASITSNFSLLRICTNHHSQPPNTSPKYYFPPKVLLSPQSITFPPKVLLFPQSITPPPFPPFGQLLLDEFCQLQFANLFLPLKRSSGSLQTFANKRTGGSTVF